MKITYNFIYLFCLLSFIHCIAMENKLVRIVPEYNDVQYPDWPLIPCKVAQQAGMFNDMLESGCLAQECEQIPFAIQGCDVKMACILAKCLKKNYTTEHFNALESAKSLPGQDFLSPYIATFGTPELIKVANGINLVDCPKVQQAVITQLSDRADKIKSIEGSQNKFDEYVLHLKNLHPDLQKLMMPVVMRGCVKKLMQASSNAFNKKRWLQNIGLFDFLYTQKSIHYFNQQTNTVVSWIKKDDEISMLHMYTHYGRLGVLRSLYKKPAVDVSTDLKKNNLHCRSIDSIDANADETLLICSYNHGSKFVVNIATGKIIKQFNDYCFSDNNDELYVIADRNLFVFNIKTEKTEKFVAWESMNAGKISTIATNKKGNVLGVCVYNVADNVYEVYIGRKNQENKFVFEKLALTQINSPRSLRLNNPGDTICWQANAENSATSTCIYNIHSKKLINMTLSAGSSCCTPQFIGNDSLCIVPCVDSSSKHTGYIINNPTTGDTWQYKHGYTYPSVGQVRCLTSQGECSIEYREEFKNNGTKSFLEAVTLFDDNCIRLLGLLKTNDLPLVVYTIVKNDPGRVALNDDDYHCYSNTQQEVRSVIDSLYVVTGESWQSRASGVVRSGWRVVRKPVLISTAFLGLIGTLIFIKHKYPPLYKFFFDKGIGVEALKFVVDLLNALI